MNTYIKLSHFSFSYPDHFGYSSLAADYWFIPWTHLGSLNLNKDWDCSSVVAGKCLSGVWEALCSVPSTVSKTKNRNLEELASSSFSDNAKAANSIIH